MAKEDLDLDVEAVAPPKKSGMLKWVIIGVGALLLVGAIVGVLYFAGVIGGGKSDPAADEAATEAAGEEHGEAGKDSKGKPGAAAAKAPLIYQSLEPPLIVNFDSKASVRFMQVTMQVATRDAATIERVKTHTPAIRNGLLMLYSSQDPTVLSTRPGKEALLKQSLEEVNRVLMEQSGEAGVESVYFTGFVMQ